MFTIRLGLIVEEQSYAPHEPVFKVLLSTSKINSTIQRCCSKHMSTCIEYAVA
jgi:hypothetical protein